MADFKFRTGDKVKHRELIGNDNKLMRGKVVDRFNSANVENWYTVRWDDYGDREMRREEELITQNK